ncbi:hypothetical protein Tco_1411453, partial [Tanacetum coccineum]
VSIVMGGISSIEARDMDTKLLSAPESNNTLARCWFRRNIPMTTFGFWHDKLPILVADCFQWPVLCFCNSWSDDPPLVFGVGVMVVVIVAVVVVVVKSSSISELSFVIT